MDDFGGMRQVCFAVFQHLFATIQQCIAHKLILLSFVQIIIDFKRFCDHICLVGLPLQMFHLFHCIVTAQCWRMRMLSGGMTQSPIVQT